MKKYINNKGLNKEFVQTMKGTRISGINVKEGVIITTEENKKTFLERLGFKKKTLKIKVGRGRVTF